MATKKSKKLSEMTAAELAAAADDLEREAKDRTRWHETAASRARRPERESWIEGSTDLVLRASATRRSSSRSSTARSFDAPSSVTFLPKSSSASSTMTKTQPKSPLLQSRGQDGDDPRRHAATRGANNDGMRRPVPWPRGDP